MILVLSMTFVATVLLLFGVTRLFRAWMRSDADSTRNRLEKDAKLIEASSLSDDERKMLRDRMKQKLQKEIGQSTDK